MPIKKVVLIVGLPGSGKTTLAESLVRDNPKALLLDDIGSLHLLDDLPEWCEDLYITGPNLCVASTRDNAKLKLMLKFGRPEIKWVFFENDPEACLINARRRDPDNKKPVDGCIKGLTQIYNIPQGEEVLAVFSVKQLPA